MKFPFTLVAALALFPLILSSQEEGEEPGEDIKINVSVPQGRVLPAERREDALLVAERLVANSPTDLSASLEKLVNPFVFQEEEVEVVETEEEPEDGDMNLQAPRNDTEVLRILAPRLQREVQGSLIMGNRKRLIWANGSSVEIGYTFKTRISANDPNIYEVTITDIQEKSFSIQLNDTEIPVPIGDSGSGQSIQRNN